MGGCVNRRSTYSTDNVIRASHEARRTSQPLNNDNDHTNNINNVIN